MSTVITSASVRKLVAQNEDKKGDPLHTMFVSLAEALERAEKAEAGSALTLDQYQRAAMRTANPECIDLSNAALGLCGEAGEFADCVKKHLHQGHALDLQKLYRECGDVLWYCALACEVLGVSLADVAQGNLDKLRLRFPEGFSHAASVGRKDAL